MNERIISALLVFLLAFEAVPVNAAAAEREISAATPVSEEFAVEASAVSEEDAADVPRTDNYGEEDEGQPESAATEEKEVYAPADDPAEWINTEEAAAEEDAYSASEEEKDAEYNEVPEYLEEPSDPEIIEDVPAEEISSDHKGAQEEDPEEIDMKDWTESNESVSKTWGGDMMGLTAALKNAADIDETNTVTVAVIDTGINAAHEWFPSERIIGGISYVEGGYADDNGHGSHVAGIIAANTPANVKILPIKALDSDMKATVDDVCDSIYYAADQGADIINLSLGFSKISVKKDYDQAVSLLSSSISYAKKKGCLIVTSAGNENSSIDEIGSYPSLSPDVITVSAISEDKSRYRFSNYSGLEGNVDFCAPGEDIYSAWKGTPSYQQLSGTSMAAPFISAALAWIMLYNPKENAVSILKTCCDSLDDPESFGNGLPVFENGVIPDLELKEEQPKIKEISCDGEGITLKWDNPEGLSFSVYRQKQRGSDFILIGSSSNGMFVDSGEDLFTHTTYYYKIVAETERYYRVKESEIRAQPFYIPITKVTIYVDGEDIGYDGEEDARVEMKVGETKRISLKIEPENATYQEIIWESSGDITIDQNGVVTARDLGRASAFINFKYYYCVCIDFVITSETHSDEEGKCGENLTWEITDGGKTLVITGEGDMYDYLGEDPPWTNSKSIPEIEKIVVEEGVHSIGRNAFKDQYVVKEFQGLRGVREIRDDAFAYCSGTLELPENVRLTDNALRDAELDKLIIPANVTYESGNVRDVFIQDNIREYIVSEDNSLLSSEDGVLFNKDKTKLISFPANRSGAYTVPDSVTIIGKYAFSWCGALEEVTMTDSVISIGDYAFSECKNLKEVTMTDSVTEIGEYAFRGTGLKNINLPDHIRSLSPGLFKSCRELTDIVLPDSVTGIGEYAFADSGLKTISIHKRISTIGNGAFEGSDLTGIVIPETVTFYGSSVFWDCSELTKAVILCDRAYLDSYAFRNCSKLEEITLPGKLTELDCQGYYDYDADPSGPYKQDNPFDGCGSLKKVTYGNFIKNFDKIENLELNERLKNAELHVDFEKTFGDLTWRVTGTREEGLTLTISGTGEMPDFSDPDAVPWLEGIDEITHIIIEDGITQVGEFEFCNIRKLKDVKLPNDPLVYRSNIFRGDPNLETFHRDYKDDDNQLHINIQYLVAKYSGKEYRPDVIVNKGAPENEESWITLAEGTDFTVEYINTRDVGDGSIVVHFIGDYSDAGDVTLPFVVTDKLLKGENIKELSDIILSNTSTIYNGKKQRPGKITVKSGRWELVAGADYALSNTEFTDKGKYTITASGIGAYTGSLSKRFEITARDISEMNISYDPKVSLAFDGTPKKPVRIDGLTEGADYTIEYSSNIDPGQAKALISGIGNYKGEREETFGITEKKKEDPKRPLPEIKLSKKSFKYNGSAQVPDVTLKDKNKTLEEGTDYTVSLLTDGINAGTQTIKVTGKGDYEGSEKTATYTIDKADLRGFQKSAYLSSDTFLYDGEAKEPRMIIPGLQEGEDFNVSYSNNTNAGTAKATAKAKDSGNYTGSFSIEFKILPEGEKEQKALTSIELSETEYTFDGNKHRPEVTVRSGDRVLEEGTEYELLFFGNGTDAGTYRVTAEGLGDYTGIVTGSFTVYRKSMGDIGESRIQLSQSEYIYDGTEKLPVLIIEGLEPDKDYTLSYIDNLEPGTATVIATGIGNYSGEIARTFVIKEGEESDTGKTEEADTGAGLIPQAKDAEDKDHDIGAAENSSGVMPIALAASGMALAGALAWFFIVWKRRKEDEEEEGGQM